jgi:hypothetical protein
MIALVVGRGACMGIGASADGAACEGCEEAKLSLVPPQLFLIKSRKVAKIFSSAVRLTTLEKFCAGFL